jgi:hypothetical protein
VIRGTSPDPDAPGPIAAHPLGPGAGVAALPRTMGFRDLVLFYVITGFTVRFIATAASAGPTQRWWSG